MVEKRNPLQSNRMFSLKRHWNIVPQYCNSDRLIASPLSNLEATWTNCKFKFTKDLNLFTLLVNCSEQSAYQNCNIVGQHCNVADKKTPDLTVSCTDIVPNTP